MRLRTGKIDELTRILIRMDVEFKPRHGDLNRLADLVEDMSATQYSKCMRPYESTDLEREDVERLKSCLLRR